MPTPNQVTSSTRLWSQEVAIANAKQGDQDKFPNQPVVYEFTGRDFRDKKDLYAD